MDATKAKYIDTLGCLQGSLAKDLPDPVGLKTIFLRTKKGATGISNQSDKLISN